jgi:hypothetical protein
MEEFRLDAKYDPHFVRCETKDDLPLKNLSNSTEDGVGKSRHISRSTACPV